MAASLASTGTPAHFVHATEWAHGDLGMLYCLECIVIISENTLIKLHAAAVAAIKECRSGIA